MKRKELEAMLKIRWLGERRADLVCLEQICVRSCTYTREIGAVHAELIRGEETRLAICLIVIKK